MKDKLKQLGRHSLVYGIGNVLSVAASFLLIPLFTHVLTPSDYGVIELLNRSADILILVMFLGVRQAFIRLYFDHDDEDWHKQVAGTTIICVLVSSAIVVAVCSQFSAIFVEKFFNDNAYVLFFNLLLVWVPFELIINIGLSFLQIQLKSKLYVIINAIKLFLIVTSNIVLVYFYNKGVLGFMVTNIWVTAIIALPFLIFFIKWSRLKFSNEVFKELFKFGLPLLPATVFMFIINNSDRYLLNYYSSLDAVGLYALAFKIGMFGTMLIMEPFGKVWAPFLFDNYKKVEGPEIVSNVFTLAVITNVTVGLFISILATPVIQIISDQAYHSSYKLVPLLCAASICYSMGNIADAGILISKKTYFSPIVHGICCVIIILLNIILIPKYSAFGAAISIAVTFFIRLVLIRIISKKYFYFKIESFKIFLLVTYSVVTYLTYLVFINMIGDSILYSSLLVVIFALFPVLVWKGRVVSDNNKVEIQSIAKKQTKIILQKLKLQDES